MKSGLGLGCRWISVASVWPRPLTLAADSYGLGDKLLAITCIPVYLEHTQRRARAAPLEISEEFPL